MLLLQYTSPLSNVEIENNGSLSTADALMIGDTITGQVANDTDKDWFSFDATAGVNYQVQFEGSKDIASSAFLNWVLSVYDSSNNLLGSITIDSENAVTNASLNIGISSTGKHYIVIEGEENIVGGTLYSAPTQPYSVTANVL